jgi:hypothetical protein
MIRRTADMVISGYAAIGARMMECIRTFRHISVFDILAGLQAALGLIPAAYAKIGSCF